MQIFEEGDGPNNNDVTTFVEAASRQLTEAFIMEQ